MMSNRTLLARRLEHEGEHRPGSDQFERTCSFSTQPLNNTFSGMMNALFHCIGTAITVDLVDNRNHFFFFFFFSRSNVHFCPNRLLKA